jgi:hypothetical protein
MRTDKHKLLTVAYTDTVATCATAHVLIWRCRESLVGVIPYFLSYLTQRARETNTLEARDRQLGRQRRPSPRRRASSRVRRWSPPPGQASTPQSCRTTAGQNERRAWPHPPPAMACSWLALQGENTRGKNSARGRTRTHSCKKGVSGVLCGCVCWTVYLFAARLNRGAGLWHARHKLCARARPIANAQKNVQILRFILYCLWLELRRLPQILLVLVRRTIN